MGSNEISKGLRGFSIGKMRLAEVIRGLLRSFEVPLGWVRPQEVSWGHKRYYEVIRGHWRSQADSWGHRRAAGSQEEGYGHIRLVCWGLRYHEVCWGHKESQKVKKGRLRSHKVELLENVKGCIYKFFLSCIFGQISAQISGFFNNQLSGCNIHYKARYWISKKARYPVHPYLLFKQIRLPFPRFEQVKIIDQDTKSLQVLKHPKNLTYC